MGTFPPCGMLPFSKQAVKPNHAPKLCLDISTFLTAADLVMLLDKPGQAEIAPLWGAARGCLGSWSQRGWVPQGCRLGCASAPLPPGQQEPQHHLRQQKCFFTPHQQCWSSSPQGWSLGQSTQPSPQPGLQYPGARDSHKLQSQTSPQGF